MHKILLSNDDGIQAEGIRALREAVGGLAETTVVAPDSQRSAVSQAITLTRPLVSRPWPPPPAEPFGIGLSGTPADCVKLAVQHLMPARPDFVFSGINLGPNAGIAALYSGTVAVATEAAIMGIPSVAFSLYTFTDPLWATAKAVARSLAARLLSGEFAIEPGICWNVNIPNLPLAELRGLRVTRTAASRYDETYVPHGDPWGNTYYWMSGDLRDLDPAPDSDLLALREGYVSLTPLRLDRTAAGAAAELAARPPSLDLPRP